MIGMTVPNVCLKTRVRDESVGGANPYRWQDIQTGDLFATGRHIIFSLPGAFTPTCSAKQLPGFEALYGDFQAAGVEAIHCISVNDAFVMYQWGKAQGVANVNLLPDGSGLFTRRMGMLVNKDHVGFGMRSWRYAIVVDEGTIVQMFVEPGCNDCGEDSDPYGETAPVPILDWVRANPRAEQSADKRELADA